MLRERQMANDEFVTVRTMPKKHLREVQSLQSIYEVARAAAATNIQLREIRHDTASNDTELQGTILRGRQYFDSLAVTYVDGQLTDLLTD